MNMYMKNNNVFKLLALFLSIAVGTLFTACKDEPDKYETAGGTPTIDYVRALSTEIQSVNDEADMHYTMGELVTSASPQSVLCFVGKNFRSVVEVYFNDLKAVLNSSYITDNTMIVQVPKNVPGEVSNKVYFICKNGKTIEYDFEVVIPAPTVNTMSCEYAAPGTTAYIYGNYFIDDPNVPLTVEFPDGTLAEDVEADETFSTISFTVPNCKVEGPIKVTSIYGETESKFHYLDTRGMLFDFDGVTGLSNHGWHDRAIESDETSITGNYMMLGDGSTTLGEDAAWNDSKFSFEYWPGDWTTPVSYPENGKKLTDLADFSNWENMAYKFEMNIPAEYPWKSGAMQIIVGGVELITMGGAGVDVDGVTVPGCNNTYFNNDELPRALYRPWTDTGSFDTGGEWITVTIPIKSSFIYGMSGAPATGSLNPDSFTSLGLFVVGGGVNGTECTPLIKIDNIRCVPN